jgi:hypothetical protein
VQLTRTSSLRIALLGIGIVAIADRALLTVIGKASPLPIVVWAVLIALAFAAPATIFTVEELGRGKRNAFRRATHRVCAARLTIYLN